MINVASSADYISGPKRCLVAKVCHLDGKIKEVNGHIQCTVTLLLSCYQHSCPLQKSHRSHWQDEAGRCSAPTALPSAAADAWDSSLLHLSFLLLLLLLTWTFPFILHSTQSKYCHHKSLRAGMQCML